LSSCLTAEHKTHLNKQYSLIGSDFKLTNW